jgi:hypothetical protein
VQVSEPDPFAQAAPPGFPYVDGEAEPQLAVDPTNQSHLVGVWIQDGLGIVAGVSFDGGSTWRSVAVPGLSMASGGTWAHSSDPWVSVAANGDVYVSALGEDANFDDKAILVNRSTDGGLTWNGAVTLVLGQNDQHDKDSITADPTNAQLAYATWTRLSSKKNDARGTTMFSRTTDGGQTWEPAREILDPGSKNINGGNQIVVLPDGTLVNFFTQWLYKNSSGQTDHYNFKLSLVRSVDHGQTWQCTNAPTAVADIRALGDTKTVTVPNPDGGAGIFAQNLFFDVALDPAHGNLYAVWPDTRFSNGQHQSIAFAMSTDGGFTWCAPIRVNQTPDDIPVGDRQAFVPSVAVAADGTVAVTYYDFRNNTAAPGLPTDNWMVHADPGSDPTNPASWTSENRLTDSSFDMEKAGAVEDGEYFVGDYMGLSAAGNHVGALWSMTHQKPDGTSDIGSIFFRDPLPAQPAGGIASHIEDRALGGRMHAPNVQPVGRDWFVEPTRWQDRVFRTAGDKGGQLPHLEHEADRTIAEPLPAGTHHLSSSGSDYVDVAVLDQLFVDRREKLNGVLTDSSITESLAALSVVTKGKPD